MTRLRFDHYASIPADLYAILERAVWEDHDAQSCTRIDWNGREWRATMCEVIAGDDRIDLTLESC